MRKLFLRMVQWRVEIKWYLLVLLGYPALLYTGLALVEGLEVLASPAESLPLLASVYLPGVLFGILMPGVGEETGWRLRRPPIPGRGWRSSAWRRWQSQC